MARAAALPVDFLTLPTKSHLSGAFRSHTVLPNDVSFSDVAHA